MWYCLLASPLIAAFLATAVHSLTVSTEGKMQRSMWTFVMFNTVISGLIYLIWAPPVL